MKEAKVNLFGNDPIEKFTDYDLKQFLKILKEKPHEHFELLLDYGTTFSFSINGGKFNY